MCFKAWRYLICPVGNLNGWCVRQLQVLIKLFSKYVSFICSQVSAISALSTSSCGSRESVAVGAGDVRRRLADATAAPPPNAFRHDPADPSATALKVKHTI